MEPPQAFPQTMQGVRHRCLAAQRALGVPDDGDGHLVRCARAGGHRGHALRPVEG